VGPTLDMSGWPSDSSAVVARRHGAGWIYQSGGRPDHHYPWASVSKVAMAFGVARQVTRGQVALDGPAGPAGSTLAHLLSHASGLGLEAGDPQRPVGTRRVYSNLGINLAVAECAAGVSVDSWFQSEVANALDLKIDLRGSCASGVHGSVYDMVQLGCAWWESTDMSLRVRDDFTRPFLAELDGIVPGWGRFSPCPWGLGLEIKGQKDHWMGHRTSPTAYGHFGQSGCLLLVDPERDLVLAAASPIEFGPWAKALWPSWIDGVLS